MSVGLRAGLLIGRGISAADFPPVASFTTSAAGLTVTFTDTSADLEDSLVAWNWSFGDGSYSTAQNPEHTYAAEGTYSVTLVVRDGAGLTAHVTAEIEVVLWDIDATSGKAAPATSDQWDNLVAEESLVVGAPDRLWLFQEASGNLADAIGGKTLTVTGTPLFQQVESGWSRRFITSNTGAAAANRFANNGTMVAATTSVLLLAYARVTAPAVSHQRMFYGGASSNAFEAVAGSNVIRIRVGAQQGNGSSSHVGQVRPYVLLHDVTNSLSILYSDIEKRAITFASRSGTTVQFQWSLSTDATSNTAFGYAAAWEGAAAEFANVTAADAAVRALLEALGWTVTGW